MGIALKKMNKRNDFFPFNIHPEGKGTDARNRFSRLELLKEIRVILEQLITNSTHPKADELQCAKGSLWQTCFKTALEKSQAKMGQSDTVLHHSEREAREKRSGLETCISNC